MQSKVIQKNIPPSMGSSGASVEARKLSKGGQFARVLDFLSTQTVGYLIYDGPPNPISFKLSTILRGSFGREPQQIPIR